MLKQFAFAALLILVSQAQAGTVLRKPTKMYIDKDSVRILKKGFAIVTEKGTFTTKSLRSDETGLYVLAQDIHLEKRRSRRHTTRSRTYWVECAVCHRWCRNEREMMNHICRRSRSSNTSRPGSDSPDWD